jgi:tagatose-1,6-bisphosphate aldolase non-catalytic subunit AgaZ/GatZ
MANARTLVDAHVRADFTKIHFDCSEGCAGEAVQVGDAVSAGRAGKLAAACQRAASDPGSLN